MPRFCERLVRSLLLDTSFEKLKSGPKQQSTSNLKRKLGDHKLDEMEGSASARKVRRRCAGCYEKAECDNQDKPV
ncbi:unnamed protein product [Adineta ricciae]|uniref:Uncharacterized protein n=1 Tax=Adineta ricciae TaxID=249248 RepID=A0A815MLW5_ADIRI|nr:unnamed protein product [Adineta ricciae]CAF1424773.1 unnamed protein product [Adineta ricciae]